MSLKEKFLKWAGQFAEETAAETVTEIAIDKFPPVFFMSIVCYASLAAALILGFVGWYFQHLVALCYVLAGIAAFVGVILYVIRSYVVSKLSKILLAGYRQVKTAAQNKIGERGKGEATNTPEATGKSGEKLENSSESTPDSSSQKPK